MKNPYKAQRLPVRTVTASLGEADYNALYLRAPLHGFQDKIISNLFSKFCELTRYELESRPPSPNPIEEEARIASLIARLALN